MELDYQTVLIALVPAILLYVEYKLGKSELPKANSILELLGNLLGFLKRK